MEILSTISPFTSLSNSILHTAAYADIFDYALTESEIHRYLIGAQSTPEEVLAVLGSGILSRTEEGTYTLPGRERLAPIRRRREEISSRLWPKAILLGRIIASLPFVRMVAVTGALAMNNVENDGDIDFLIVTTPGRLWFCRGLILLVGRLVGWNKGRVCPNYLVSLRALSFPEQSLYTAHEIAQMIPLAGLSVYNQIRRQNPWVLQYLPNASGAPAIPGYSSQPPSYSLARPALEAVLQTMPFSLVERWEMDRKIRQLWREQRDNPESDFSANICKGHAQRHGARTRTALEERLSRLQGELLS